MKQRLLSPNIRFLLQKSVYFLFALILLVPILGTICHSVFSPEAVQIKLSQRGSFDTNRWMSLLLPLDSLSLDQYQLVLWGNNGILQRFFLSAFYTSAILAGQVLVVPGMAYALTMYRFRGKNLIFLLLILLMLLPFQVTMVPNMLMLRSMNLLDTVWAVIFPAWFSPFYFFLISHYMANIPCELYEAAQLDGAGPIRCFFWIALPSSSPVLGAAAVLSFADAWNMVEQPLAFLKSREELLPLSSVFNQLTNAPQGIEFAGAVIYMLPALFVYLFFLEDITAGLRAMELK